jgi:transglutaminase-like putative cysteine protease
MTATTPNKFSVVHRTEYSYGASMADGYTVVHLLPRDSPTQRVMSAELHVTPDPDEYDEHVDLFGNRVVRLGVHQPHQHLGVVARCVVELLPMREPSPAAAAIGWEDVVRAVATVRGNDAIEVGPYAAPTAATHSDPQLRALLDEAFVPGRSFLDAVRILCSRIFEDFVFDSTFSDVSTPIEAVLAARRGVCQDFAHLALACLRSVGLAGRYVSGYIETLPPPGEEKLVGADASHAWCSAWAPGLGWVDFDPTNDQMPPERHVTVAWGRDYHDVAPVRGVVIGPPSQQTLLVGVDVTRVD